MRRVDAAVSAEGPPRPAWEPWADALVLGAVLAFVALRLQPDLLLLPTTPSGGDILSHYATAVYFREHLLPAWKLSGWAQGNYAGFPILQFYFPLPFLLMAGLSAVVALPVAFKLVTVLGTVTLPLAAYAVVRLAGRPFPAPALAAVATPIFLFQEGNSMWGGNVMSTLAGEFAFSLGLSLAVLCLGTVWAGIERGRGLAANAVLLALVGLAHGYALLVAGLTTLGLAALTRDRWAAIRYLLAVYGLAFCLLGWWLLPLLANLPYTTAFAPAWFIKEWTEVLPRDLWGPAAAACGWSLWLAIRRVRWGAPVDSVSLYFWYGIGISAAGYLLGPWLGVVDVRFIPFGQFLLLLLAAVGVGTLARRIPGGPLPVLGLAGLLTGWSVSQSSQIPSWIAWNYAGAEQKGLWPAFVGVNRVLTGTASDPRVVYEHSMIHNGAGTPRVFETLPLYSGRSTLEGLYLQASPTAPFVFYVQAELSKEASCPFSHVACTHFNLPDALRHLRLFNVGEIIAVSDQLKEALRKRTDVELLARVPPYEVFRLREPPPPGYVEPLAFEPVLVREGNWKDLAYRWFRLTDQLDVPLVFPVNVPDSVLARFVTVSPDAIGHLPRRPVPLGDGSSGPVRTWLSEETIEFDTPYVGRPHLIRVSYHPNWRVEGAQTIYLVSPAFMLVYPKQGHVRLWYGWAWPDRLGAGLTGAAVLGLLLARLPTRRRWITAAAPFFPAPVRQGLGTVGGLSAASLPIGLVTVALALGRLDPSPHVLLNEGIQARDRRDYDGAVDRLRRVLARAPSSGAAEQAAYYLATVSYLRGDMERALQDFGAMIRLYPSSPFVPEGYYHLGLANQRLGRLAEARAAFRTVRDQFPESAWARYAQDRLAELVEPSGAREGP
ncbi:6-pyruvoyl-tetrahydropterin synthase-related protein [Nitrospira sp. Kam-Ns4a]